MIITVISPTFNVEDEIQKSLQSVSIQSYSGFEYLIQDGGSEDGTREVVKEYCDQDQRFKLYVENDAGIYDAMNKAIEKANGDYCIFLGAGDRLYDSYTLEKVVRNLENKTPDIIYGYVVEENPDGTEREYKEKLDMWYTVKFRPVCHQAIIAKTELLRDRPFDITYRIAADQDWLLCMKKKRKIIKYIDIPIAYYPRDGVSSSPEGGVLFIKEKKNIQKTYYPVRWFFYNTYFELKKQIMK